MYYDDEYIIKSGCEGCLCGSILFDTYVKCMSLKDPWNVTRCIYLKDVLCLPLLGVCVKVLITLYLLVYN